VFAGCERRATHYVEAINNVGLAKRKQHGDARRLDAGQRTYARDGFCKEGRAAVVIRELLLIKCDCERKHALGRVAWVSFQEPVETFHQESRAYEKNKR